MADKIMVNWTAPMLRRFRVAYSKAVKHQMESFEFDGNQYVVGYAKYLIEYLDSLSLVG